MSKPCHQDLHKLNHVTFAGSYQPKTFVQKSYHCFPKMVKHYRSMAFVLQRILTQKKRLSTASTMINVCLRDYQIVCLHFCLLLLCIWFNTPLPLLLCHCHSFGYAIRPMILRNPTYDTTHKALPIMVTWSKQQHLK